MDDTWLINMYHYFKNIIKVSSFGREHLAIVEELLMERGIKVSNFPKELPYKIDGKWLIWAKGRPREATEEEVLKHKLCIRS